MTPQEYLRIARAFWTLREAHAAAEIARLNVAHCDARYALAMRDAGLDPGVTHRFDDETLTITPQSLTE